VWIFQPPPVVLAPCWLQNGGGDHPGRSESGDEPVGWIAKEGRGQIAGRHHGSGLAVKVRRLLTTQMTTGAAWEHKEWSLCVIVSRYARKQTLGRNTLCGIL